MIFRLFSRTVADRRGAVAILTALSIPVLLGMAGLVAEFGHGLLYKVEDQRIADLAAFEAATIYNSTGSTSSMQSAATAAAALNGVSTGVTASVVTSPTGDGSQAVKVVVSTSMPLMLTRVLGTGPTLPVDATAYAELKPGANGCIVALNNSGSGVTLSGGTSVTAAGCAVASNAAVSVPCGTTVTTTLVDYNSSSAPSEPCSGIQPPTGSSLSITKTITTDPLAGNAAVSAATGRVSTAASLASPSAPSVSGGTAVTFGYSASTTQNQLAADGCSGTFSSPTWTVTCPSGGTYTFGAISLSGGITVNFNTGGSASTTYRFSGAINNSGTALNFGPGTYYVAGGITSGGGTTTTFGAGSFYVGQSSTACNGGGKYSICNGGTTMSFAGPSDFVLSAGVYNKGGSNLTLGTGSGNSFQVGASSDGNALYIGGGASTVVGDGTSSSDFQFAGNINVASGGGSCTEIGVAGEHDIKGYMSLAGGTVLGAGVYTVSGYIAMGANGGGDVSCFGSTIGVSGADVTLVAGGASTPSSGTCSGQAFCMAAGYNHVTLTAPTSGSTANLVVVGPAGSNAAGATFTEGATNTSLSGAFYFPSGPISLSGGATVGNGTGQCLELIGSQVSLSGGSAAASSCLSGSSSPTQVALVQ